MTSGCQIDTKSYDWWHLLLDDVHILTRGHVLKRQIHIPKQAFCSSFRNNFGINSWELAGNWTKTRSISVFQRGQSFSTHFYNWHNWSTMSSNSSLTNKRKRKDLRQQTKQALIIIIVSRNLIYDLLALGLDTCMIRAEKHYQSRLLPKMILELVAHKLLIRYGRYVFEIAVPLEIFR